MLSFWETQSFIQYDYIIVGSGIVGLSTAASLLEKNKQLKVLIIERGLLPSGASTKNAGFACFGSLTEILSDLEILPEEKVLELVRLRYNGFNKLLQRLGTKAIGYEATGGYELLFNEHDECLNKIDFLNQLLYPVFNDKSITINNKLITDFGFNKVKSIIHHPFEGQINTGIMMNSLIKYVQQLGANIITGCELVNYENNNHEISISCKSIDNNISFKARAIAFCTNAFTKKYFPQYEINAGRGQVLITKPIPNLKFNGVFHFDEGYYYFRNVSNRVLFGGGRNLDFDTESTTEMGVTELIINNLKEKLREIILPNTSFEIEQIWSGIMAFGKNKFPIIESPIEKVVIAARLGGMGVAIGSQLGEEAAVLLLNQ